MSADKPKKTPKPEWWPENPYSEIIFTMTTEQYCEAIPDGHLRTAISGYLMRSGWNVASEMIALAIRDQQEDEDDSGPATDALKILDDMLFNTPARQASLRKAIRRQEIAEKVYNIRKVFHLSRKELAKKVSVRRRVIRQIEDADYHGDAEERLQRIIEVLEGGTI